MRPDEVDPAVLAVPVQSRFLSEPSDEDGVRGTSLGRYLSAPFDQERVTVTYNKTNLLSPSGNRRRDATEVKVVRSGWMLFTV